MELPHEMRFGLLSTYCVGAFVGGGAVEEKTLIKSTNQDKLIFHRLFTIDSTFSTNREAFSESSNTRFRRRTLVVSVRFTRVRSFCAYPGVATIQFDRMHDDSVQSTTLGDISRTSVSLFSCEWLVLNICAIVSSKERGQMFCTYENSFSPIEITL